MMNELGRTDQKVGCMGPENSNVLFPAHFMVVL